MLTSKMLTELFFSWARRCGNEVGMMPRTGGWEASGRYADF